MSALVVRAGRVAVRMERRAVVTAAALTVVACGLALLGLCQGATWYTPGEVLAALTGRGGGTLVITEWRMPRVCAALVFGAALGVAGAVFQNLTRNALGSPDIIGLDAGSYTGALAVITLVGGTSLQLALGSVAGGLAAAGVVYALSVKSGLSGMRLIVVGIAVNAMLTALNGWIVLRAELEVAIAATGWSAGSLNGLDWDEVALPFALIGVLLALLGVLSHAVHQAALGDELAVTSGVDLRRLRLLLVLVGVGCTAVVTSAAGPIVFVALAAPQIGRRLAGSAGVPFVPAALTGAVLLLAADLAAQTLLAPVALPVGVVTTAIGGAYLIWLLIKEAKKP
ncbi:FecCD family ABC transporter permease [Actinocorallia sp. A-T 12471]|uniref:FecCD family ABC transporter permease n=1 Tax=Actinocorallia sp. A-T 12471 TaxID=3089813 RepID=UPI0029CF3CEB|nr:iron chelate uptake ABC transporter family permease subunit [Actinocorallia sp. A-T 12471]MDX6742333.1 iron chelate uptake ABC transporter family permease subunit [Actinocorallia sp. A-T 12471]